MTQLRSQPYAAARYRDRWVRRFVLSAVLALGACSVSMPMPGFVDQAPTGSIAGKGADKDSPNPHKVEPAAESADLPAEL